MYQDNQETLCALTEQGDLGLGAHQVTDAQERADLQRRLNEMQRQTNSQGNTSRR